MAKVPSGERFRKPPYYKFNPSDFHSSLWVQQMTSEQKSWYRTMLDNQWMSESCMLVNDDNLLPIYAGIRVNTPDGEAELERFTKTGWIVLQRFKATPDGKYIFNQRMLDEYEEFLASRLDAKKAGLASAKSMSSDERSERARLAARKRWETKDVNANESMLTDANAMLTDANQTETRDIEAETEKPSTTPLPPSRKGEKKKRTKTESPLEFTPETKGVVNEVILMWPKVRPNGKPCVIETAPLAQRIDAILRDDRFDKGLIIGAARRYLAENPEYLHAPQFFFGPGKDRKSPPWLPYARFEYKDRQAKQENLYDANV